MRRIIPILTIVVLMAACAKEPVNPFDQVQQDTPTATVTLLPLNNFAGLHQRVFRPSCALSGCHDGTFEPDFRTIGSSYSSLVYHPVVGNDPNGSFTYRVLPGEPYASYLHERLTTEVPNTSGMMPAGFDEGSDWPQHGATYVNAIRQWIQDGAKDMFGNAPALGNLEPQAVGLLCFPAGSTSNPYPRATGSGVQPIAVPAGNVDLWFAFADDHTAPQDLQVNTWKLTNVPANFAAVPALPFSMGQTITGPDFGGGTVPFTHKAALDLNAYPNGTVLFVRAYVNDGDHAQPTEIPNDGTGAPMLAQFTLIIVP